MSTQKHNYHLVIRFSRRCLTFPSCLTKEMLKQNTELHSNTFMNFNYLFKIQQIISHWFASSTDTIILVSVHVKASLSLTTHLQTMPAISGRLHYLKNLSACVVYVGTLTMLSQCAGSKCSDLYWGSELLHHQNNARPFIHTHPGCSRVVHFGPGNIPVSIKSGMFQQLIYSARGVCGSMQSDVQLKFSPLELLLLLKQHCPSVVWRETAGCVFLFITQSSHYNIISMSHWWLKNKVVTLPVKVCHPLSRSYSSTPWAIAAECPILSPRAGRTRPCPQWRHLQNRERLWARQTLKPWTTSWYKATQTSTCQSQICRKDTVT